MIKPSIRISIVSYNSANELERCITSARQACVEAGMRPSIVVVDNKSLDDSEKVARKCGAIYIQNEVNLGFSKATNLGLRHNDPSLKDEVEYYLVLNPDTVMSKDSLKKMASTLLSDPSIGAVGPRLASTKMANEEYYLREPSVFSVLLFSTVLGKFCAQSSFLRNRIYSFPVSERVVFVPQIPGACLLTTRRALFDIGPLDESYSIWFEDVDWSHKARKKKYKLAYSPEAKVYHEGGVSFSKWRGLSKSITFYVSMKNFFKKNKPLQYPFFMLIVTLNAALLMIVKRNRDQFIFMKSFWKLKQGDLPS